MTQTYSAYSIIQKKRDKEKLSKEEINWFIQGLIDHTIADYQMSALLMAIYLCGMDIEETAHLTDAMLYSGKVLNFPEQHFIDKHSTGGVGDKATFVLAPIAAACGVKVPMIAGRGLGHTGGTIDKIESIKGFKTDISLEEFEELLHTRGLVLIGQTKDIAPADKKIYSLRDVTATIESIPLITASIMSKKLAEGAKGIVMDIKTGNGAFMSKLSDAKKLASSIRKTGHRFDKNMMTMITDMSEPLGLAVGNALEVIESIETLKGRGPKDLTDLSVALAGGMIYLAGLSKTLKDGMKKAQVAIDDGSALEKFRELIKNQGGDVKVIDDYTLLPHTKTTHEVKAHKAGYITKMECTELGKHCVRLGGGRQTTSGVIDFAVGFVMNKKIGDKVAKGDVLMTIHCHENQLPVAQEITHFVHSRDITISPTKPRSKKKLILEVHTQFAPKKKKHGNAKTKNR
ncbi:MAG: thymidine phosphorylase [Bacteriovorax sp.]|nr:thymidine phosphorylase [Bacteriovorax sp.]